MFGGIYCESNCPTSLGGKRLQCQQMWVWFWSQLGGSSTHGQVDIEVPFHGFRGCLFVAQVNYGYIVYAIALAFDIGEQPPLHIVLHRLTHWISCPCNVPNPSSSNLWALRYFFSWLNSTSLPHVKPDRRSLRRSNLINQVYSEGDFWISLYILLLSSSLKFIIGVLFYVYVCGAFLIAERHYTISQSSNQGILLSPSA